MRTTRGKPTHDRILLGDSDLAEALAQALGVEEQVERYAHHFHTYPAGLHPDAARDLLSLFEGPRVLDPFCGGGTVLVETRAAGRVAIGRDLSSTALRVARARTASPDEAFLTRLRSRARKLTAVAQEARDMPPEQIYQGVHEWYAPHALYELESIRRGIEESDEDLQPLLWALFSSILIKTSWRKSDTSAQRVKHKRPAGTTAILFHKKTRELARKLAEFAEAVPEGTPEADLAQGDARELRIDGRVNLALTSPPYPGTYDYLPLQHLRRIWFQEDRHEDPQEIGSRRSWRGGTKTARRDWAAATAAWTTSVANALLPGGHLVIVIGDGLTPAGPIDASEITEKAAQVAGLESVARASLERPDHARRSTRWEHVFAYRKPE
ncbi:MAG: hypothetical protein EP330_02120 [Deltaproteobacteria bacterium]|nr:MAG: hypothetical protein EP330_02120 [Deltaproteobacteria bacterium]